MTEPARHLRPVQSFDSSTGEVCAHCEELERTLTVFQNKYRAALSEIGRLKADPEAVARKHQLWDEAEGVHHWWRLACWHPATRFAADEFYLALPRLKERGPVELLKAVAGAAYEPGSRVLKNGDTMRYDQWELICRSKAKCDGFAQRVFGGAERERWKRWLIERVESNLSQPEEEQ